MTMKYVFDNNSLSKLKHFYPNVFKTIWAGLDELVEQGLLISTREVWNEAQRGAPNPYLLEWLTQRKDKIFTTPTPEEMAFVAEILRVKHFRGLIGKKQQMQGTPVADPFVVACAKVRNGYVISDELYKPNAAKIPNVCEHFGLECLTLEEFMEMQEWRF